MKYVINGVSFIFPSSTATYRDCDSEDEAMHNDKMKNKYREIIQDMQNELAKNNNLHKLKERILELKKEELEELKGVFKYSYNMNMVKEIVRVIEPESWINNFAERLAKTVDNIGVKEYTTLASLNEDEKSLLKSAFQKEGSPEQYAAAFKILNEIFTPVADDRQVVINTLAGLINETATPDIFFGDLNNLERNEFVCLLGKVNVNSALEKFVPPSYRPVNAATQVAATSDGNQTEEIKSQELSGLEKLIKDMENELRENRHINNFEDTLLKLNQQECDELLELNRERSNYKLSEEVNKILVPGFKVQLLGERLSLGSSIDTHVKKQYKDLAKLNGNEREALKEQFSTQSPKHVTISKILNEIFAPVAENRIKYVDSLASSLSLTVNPNADLGVLNMLSKNELVSLLGKVDVNSDLQGFVIYNYDGSHSC